MIPLLEGIGVLELGTVVLGPYAGQILADLGADVVKVEPIDGDIARAAHPRGAGMGALYANNNRNKRTISIDLKSAEGREIVMRLAGERDVLLHNMRADAAERLGLGFDALAERNPRLIYCAAIGFGQQGRYRNRPAFDDVIQAASGLAGLVAHAGGEPRFVPTILADKVAALHTVYGILAALVARANGRTGAIRVDVPMFEAMAAFLLNEHLAGATFERDGRTGYERVLSSNRRPYRTRDGWIAVLPYTHEQWRRFLSEVGRHDILGEPWFAEPASRQARLDFLYGVIATALTERTTAEWMSAFSRLDIPASEINTLASLLDDPHLADVGFFDVDPSYPPEIVRMIPQPVQFHGIEPRADRPPPAHGADTRALLRSCGYGEADIDRLIASGVASDGSR